MIAKGHSSITARMPLFLIFEMQCSRLKAEKLPTVQILRSRSMDGYSGVPTPCLMSSEKIRIAVSQTAILP